MYAGGSTSHKRIRLHGRGSSCLAIHSGSQRLARQGMEPQRHLRDAGYSVSIAQTPTSTYMMWLTDMMSSAFVVQVYGAASATGQTATYQQTLHGRLS